MIRERPPLGLIPRWLHNELNFDNPSGYERLCHINAAIQRYTDVLKPIPIEWFEEKDEILKENN